MKHFIGAHVEGPHFCFYTEIDDDPHFSGMWAWADKEGLPENGAMYYDNLKDAKETVKIFRKSGAGLSQDLAESIQVVSLNI